MQQWIRAVRKRHEARSGANLQAIKQWLIILQTWVAFYKNNPVVVYSFGVVWVSPHGYW